MMALLQFLVDTIRATLSGSRRYWIWVTLLAVLFVHGVFYYANQMQTGLVVTGMSDQVSWGFYISNFAFFVGIAAAAVLLVIPAYIFHRKDIKQVVLLGEGMAVAAVLVAMMFVLVDLGRPERAWHFIPFIGRFNFPNSILAWDVIVLNGYLLLNAAILGYVLFLHYLGLEPKSKIYTVFVVLAMFWAISIHTVTAFMFSSNPGRAMWHTSLLGPRFISSAFASGPALIIITLGVIHNITRYQISRTVIDTLALILTIALQISLFFVGVELFTDFYNEGEHGASIRYLFLGLEGLGSLRPWIWAAVIMNLIAVTILMIHPLRQNMKWLNTACVLTFLGIWIEKGMGLVVPGFIPTTLGEVFEYFPTATEFSIAVGIWSFGMLVFTLLAKIIIAIELGQLKYKKPGQYREGAYIEAVQER
jgi:molybdopterin-containing oxidoreductase family membrane subunit